jgi:serine protease
MRTVLIGIIGGALVFAYFWYRGDVGTVNLGPLGEFEPPAVAESLVEKLSELQVAERAVRAEFLPGADVVDFDARPKFYAGQLIAKPRRDPSAARAAGDAAAVSAAAPGEALLAASRIGAVDSRLDGTMMISIDYDLMAEEEETAEAAEPSTRAFAADEGRPLSFSVGPRTRAAAERAKARILEDGLTECPEGITRDMIRANPGLGVACALEELQQSGEFEYVERNHIVTHEMMDRRARTLTAGPSDPLYGMQWNYRGQGDGADQSRGGAGFAEFWERADQRGSRDIVVAIVDTGIDMSHPDIKDSPNVAPGVDMVSVPFYGNDGGGRDTDPNDPGDICDPSDPFAEDSFHGTHVAGTIGAVATDNGAGVAGAAWEVTIVPVRALGRCGGLQSDINEAIRWAAGVTPAIVEHPDGGQFTYANENPADIINLSLGFRAPDGCPASTQEAINDAVAAGAIVVAAAGNAGIDVAGYGPSGCDNVITVAAGDAVGALARYSNWGEGVDVMAPGGDMRADADGDGRPDGVLSTKRSKNCVDPVSGEPIDECAYSYEQGTSMAAPHVSAALALLKSADRAATNDELASLIVDRARRPRDVLQCTGACASTPGGVPVDGNPDVCLRPCGSGLLDLGLAVDDGSGS